MAKYCIVHTLYKYPSHFKRIRDFVQTQNNWELLVAAEKWQEKLETQKLASVKKAKQLFHFVIKMVLFPVKFWNNLIILFSFIMCLHDKHMIALKYDQFYLPSATSHKTTWYIRPHWIAAGAVLKAGASVVLVVVVVVIVVIITQILIIIWYFLRILVTRTLLCTLHISFPF